MSNEFSICKIFEKILINNHIGHAYLLEVDNSYNTNIAINFVKKILEKEITDISKLENIFFQIDKNIFSDLKIIKPDGKQIKKEQIFNLMSEYKNKSINNLKRFYIVEYAENLNPAAGNSLLKFLEEPENDIIAILITKNIYDVLETIVSRCQILNLNNYNLNNFLEEDIFRAIDFLKIYENKREKSIAYLTELYLLNSVEIQKIFNIWSVIYESILIYKINKKIKIFYIEEDIKKISENNTKNEIIIKLKRLEQLIKKFESNVNTRVILDQFLLGGDTNERKDC